MKKKLVYAMLVAASMSLCACGGTKDAPVSEEPVATEETAETEETDAEETDAEETDAEEGADAEETDAEEDADAEAGDAKAKELLDSLEREDVSYINGECTMSMTISADGTDIATDISLKIEADKDYSHSFTDVTTLGQTVSVETWMDNTTGACMSQTDGTDGWVQTDAADNNAALADSMSSFHMDEEAIAEYGMQEETDDYYVVYVVTNPGYMNTLSEGQDVDYGDSYCDCLYYFDKETESLSEVELVVNIDNSAMAGYEIKDYVISFVYEDLIFGETDKTVTPPEGLF